MTAPAKSDTHVLYRFRDAGGRLLYVGITNNPPRRFKSHGKTKDWWGEVSTINIESFDSREALEDAERTAIKSEHPAYNVVHNEMRTYLESNPIYIAAMETFAEMWECARVGVEGDLTPEEISSDLRSDDFPIPTTYEELGAFVFDVFAAAAVAEREGIESFRDSFCMKALSKVGVAA